jgi:prepilin-type N-terminal cleavage/methylation domain-containing protein
MTNNECAMARESQRNAGILPHDNAAETAALQSAAAPETQNPKPQTRAKGARAAGRNTKHETRNTNRRGFTLIELIIGMVLGSVILITIGLVMFQVFGGFREMTAFNENIIRVELIRQLNFDGRTADSLLHPATNGATGSFGAQHGAQMVQFRSIIYTPGDEETAIGTDEMSYVIWESSRPNSEVPFTVRRFATNPAPRTATVNPPADRNQYRQTFAQEGITRFDVRRESARNFTVQMRTELDGEAAAVDLSITLRNVQ